MNKPYIVFKQGYSQKCKVFLHDIIFIEAKRNCCELKLSNNKTLLLTKPLSKIEQIEELQAFERIHRKYIINPEYITAYNKGRNPSVTTTCGIKIPLSVKKISYIETLF